MNVKILLFSVTIIALSISAGCSHKKSTNSNNTSIKVEATTFQRLTNEHIAYASAIWELASARFVVDRKMGRKNILTIHKDGYGVRKYFDGQYTVISLPAPQSSDGIGLGLFVADYNLFSVMEADAMALAGNTKEARVYYGILVHFTASDLLRVEINRKLEILDSLENKELSGDKLSEFRQLNSQYFSRLKLFEAESATPVVVTNLLDLPTQ
jgi:hypothetical protein